MNDHHKRLNDLIFAIRQALNAWDKSSHGKDFGRRVEELRRALDAVGDVRNLFSDERLAHLETLGQLASIYSNAKESPTQYVEWE
jgi:hypothetical protein